MVKCAVATCWEEGPKAYRNANNSWYTLFDGGPWNPWIPSKYNIHCPASSSDDDIGIVAIPHLSRDLQAVFDGPGSYFGTHPQNILRGMVYEKRSIPYFANLVDQYRSLAAYNEGYSYMLRGNFVKARAKFLKACELDPTNQTIRNNLELLNGSQRFVQRAFE